MGAIFDGFKTINSLARTILFAISVGVLGLVTYVGYSEYTKRDRLLQDQEEQIQLANERMVTLESEIELQEAKITELGLDLRQKIEQIEKLETSMLLLKTDQRLARLRVVNIDRDEAGNAITSKLEFIELSPQGEPLSAAKSFELPGDVIYIDNWIVKFADSYIEKGDIERGTSLCLFRRIFSEQQQPTDGVLLDEIGTRPQAYARGGAMSEFERKLWSEFWEFANDSDKAQEMGIRAANGEAVSIKVREGKSYNISLRASGGLSIEPVQNAPDGDGQL